VQVRKRRSAGCYFTILGKMKIAENEGRRYGTAGHVGQLSSTNCSTFTVDSLMNWASEYLCELKLVSMLVDPEVHTSGPRSAGHSSKSYTSAYSPSACVPFPHLIWLSRFLDNLPHLGGSRFGSDMKLAQLLSIGVGFPRRTTLRSCWRL
jgi:hypothetical protein